MKVQKKRREKNFRTSRYQRLGRYTLSDNRADDSKAWEPVVGRVTQQLNQVTAEVQALQNANTLRLQTTGRCLHRNVGNSSKTQKWGTANAENKFLFR